MPRFIVIFFGKLIATIWWLQILLSATVAGILLGCLFEYLIFEQFNFFLIKIAGAIGFVYGVCWAERVRKNIGLDKFFGTITGTVTKKSNMKREDY